jgi:2-hydroxychromene-2-carboxylate isomerase
VPVVAADVDVIHFTDPSCPWAYSAEPFMRALEWRYGDALRWRTVMIGLSESTSGLERSGMTPESRLRGWKEYERRFGMPVLGRPRSRLIASGRACRAVKAAQRQGEAAGTAMLRAVRLAWFTSTDLADEDAVLVRLAGEAPGVDPAAVESGLHDQAVEAAYQADRAEARSALVWGAPAIAQERAAVSPDGARFTAPSLVFRAGNQQFVAGGWQPFEAYDLCVANLAPGIPRRGRPAPAELLRELPGLTTAEVAEVWRDRNDPRDIGATRTELDALCDRGEVSYEPIGDGDHLWYPRS